MMMVRIDTMDGLGDTYMELDKFADAEVIFKQCWMSRKATLGERDPSTLDSLSSYAIACVYQDTEEKYTEALDLYNQLLAMQKGVIGSDHPDTLDTMSNMATTYCKLGRITEALSMYNECLIGIKIVLGENHPSTIMTQNCINLVDK